MLSKSSLALKLLCEAIASVAIVISGVLITELYFKIEDDPFVVLLVCTTFSSALYFIHPCYTCFRLLKRLNETEDERRERVEGTKPIHCPICRLQSKHHFFEYATFLVHCAFLIGCFVEPVALSLGSRGHRKVGLLAPIYAAWMFVSAAIHPFVAFCICCYGLITEDDDECDNKVLKPTVEKTTAADDGNEQRTVFQSESVSFV